MPWTTPVADGDHLFGYAAGYPLYELVEGINARIAALVAAGKFSLPQSNRNYISCAVGNDATTCRLWNSFRNAAGMAEGSTIDAWLIDNTSTTSILNYHKDPTNPAIILTMQSARNQLGLPVTIWPGSGGITNRFMRRKRYRRFNNILGTATQDDHGNAAVAGQRAYDYQGNQWLCISSGNWERDNGGMVDVLDNTLAPPDYVAEVNNFSVFTARPGGYTQYGQVRPGDILGPWVFEERRQLLSLCTTIA